jgi:hypothetical protein
VVGVGAFAVGGIAAVVVVVVGVEVPTVEWPQPTSPSDTPLTSATAPIPESSPPPIRTNDDRTGFDELLGPGQRLVNAGWSRRGHGMVITGSESSDRATPHRTPHRT